MKPKRFASRRHPEYLAWIHDHSCYLRRVDLRHRCEGRIDAAHLVSKGAGGDDLGNVVPVCHGSHMEQHTVGILTWCQRHGITREELTAEAQRLAEVYAAR